MSTHTSRRTFVADTTTFATFRVHGEPDFAVIPPVTCQRGNYRVDLDLETYVATFTLICLVPTGPPVEPTGEQA